MNRFSEALDRYITGNYGEDQFKDDKPPCKKNCKCPECVWSEETHKQAHKDKQCVCGKVN